MKYAGPPFRRGHQLLLVLRQRPLLRWPPARSPNPTEVGEAPTHGDSNGEPDGVALPTSTKVWLGACAGVAVSLLALGWTDNLQDLHSEAARQRAVYAAEGALLKRCIAAAPIVVEHEKAPKAPDAAASVSASADVMTHTTASAPTGQLTPTVSSASATATSITSAALSPEASVASERGRVGEAKARAELVSFDARGASAPARRELSGSAENMRLLAACDTTWRGTAAHGNSDSSILRHAADPGSGLNGALRFFRLFSLVLLAVSMAELALRLLGLAKLPVESLTELAAGKRDESDVKAEGKPGEGGSHIAKMIGTTVVTGITGLSVLGPELVQQTLDTVRTSETRVSELQVREHESQRVTDTAKELRMLVRESVLERGWSGGYASDEVRAQLTTLAQRIAVRDERTAHRLDDLALQLRLMQANQSLKVRLDPEVRNLFVLGAQRLAILGDRVSVIDSKVDLQSTSTSQALSDLNAKVATTTQSLDTQLRSFDESLDKTRRGTRAMLDYSLDVERHSWSPFRGQVKYRQSLLDIGRNAVGPLENLTSQAGPAASAPALAKAEPTSLTADGR